MAETFLSIIIPAHNEAARLPGNLDALIPILANQSFLSEIILVENASTDKTWQVCENYSKKYPDFVSPIKLAEAGKGGAIKAGMLSAKGKYRLFADADFSMPPAEIFKFIPPQIDVPIAIASREAPGSVRYNEPFYRHFTGRIFNSLIRLMVLPSLQDTQCGFKMFREDVVKLIFPKQTMLGWSFDVEILYIASRMGIPILEIPIPWYYNDDSKVKVFRDSFRMFTDLLQIRNNGLAGIYDDLSSTS
ncbi:MAG TPA: dolichyl-phosphate beta-glucosyltransferase [Anaerolineales bacterium]|nr:dolichyl-phosphate beta-glucosyltransferase [Anaerolineales bacterium]